MNTKQNRRVQMTQKLIKDALIELMIQKPISHITVKQICERADINRSTFYLHYADQYALLEELENDTVNMTPRINLYQDKEIYKPLFELFTFIDQNKQRYMVLFKNSSGASFRNKVLDKVFGKNEQKPQWISNMSFDNSLHVKMLFCALGGVSLIENWVFDKIQATPQELARAFDRQVAMH